MNIDVHNVTDVTVVKRKFKGFHTTTLKIETSTSENIRFALFQNDKNKPISIEAYKGVKENAL